MCIRDSVMGLRNIGIIKLQLSQTQRAHVTHRLRSNAFENALGQWLSVLKQAIDPWIVEGVEGKSRGINAAAPGGVGDHGAGRAVASGATLIPVSYTHLRAHET